MANSYFLSFGFSLMVLVNSYWFIWRSYSQGQLSFIYLVVLFSWSTLNYLFSGPIVIINSYLLTQWSNTHDQLLFYLAVLFSWNTLIYSPSGRLILMINSYLSYFLLLTSPGWIVATGSKLNINSPLPTNLKPKQESARVESRAAR